MSAGRIVEPVSFMSIFLDDLGSHIREVVQFLLYPIIFIISHHMSGGK